MRRRHAISTRLALVALGSSLALLLAEAGARVYGATFRGDAAGAFLQYDERIGWSNRPGFVGRHRTENFDVSVHVDGVGCRVAGSSNGVPSFDQAVLMMGDSTTFGWGVEEPQTFAAHLRTRLEAPVHNLGVSGLGTDQQLLQLRDVLARSRPRAVVVTFTPNDVLEVTQARPYRRSKPRFELRAEGLQLQGRPPPRDWLLEHCHIWRTAMRVTGRLRPPELTDAQREVGRELVVRLYEEMQRACREAGCGFLLVTHHAPWLRRRADALGLRCCDVTDVFDRLAALGPIRFPEDGHWLPHVHEEIALALLPSLVEMGLELR